MPTLYDTRNRKSNSRHAELLQLGLFALQEARVKPQLVDGHYDLDLIGDVSRGVNDELDRLIQELPA